MKKDNIISGMMGEFFGTFILILFGCGVVANVGLAPRLAASAYGWITIALGWGMAVTVAVYTTAGVSGAHINPAVTIAMAIKRGFPWSKVVPYIIAQIAGAFVGALGVYLVYRDGMVAAGLPNIYCTGPGSVFGQAFWGSSNAGVAAVGSYSLLNATVAEIFGTAALLWGVIASGDSKNTAVGANLGPLLCGLTVLAVGLCLSGPSGYAINPARDFGPRIFGFISGTTGLFDDLYWLVAPIIGPIIGGILGVVTYDIFVTPHLPDNLE